MKHHSITLDFSKKPEARKWARQMFGPSKPTGAKIHQCRWFIREVYKNRETWDLDVKFYFKNETDLAWFKMRWE